MEIIVGVDLHRKNSSFAALGPGERILQEETFDNGRRKEIESFIRKWKTPDSTVTLVVEACGFWYWFVKLVTPLVDRVVLADPYWAKRRLDGRAAKNDRIDAIDLAKLFIRKLVVPGYVMAQDLRDLRDLLRTRLGLVQQRTAMKNRIRAALAQHGLNGPTCRVLYSDEGMKWVRGQKALSSVWQAQLNIQIGTVIRMDGQIAELEAIATCKIRPKDHPELTLLESIPGVGRIWAMTLLLEIGDIRRFPSGDTLVCYCGLAPTVHESGEHRHYTGLHAHRNNWLKGALGMIAMHARRSPRLEAEYQRARRRYKAIVATIVIARKVARIIHCMLTKKEMFRESDPKAALSA